MSRLCTKKNFYLMPYLLLLTTPPSELYIRHTEYSSLQIVTVVYFKYGRQGQSVNMHAMCTISAFLKHRLETDILLALQDVTCPNFSTFFRHGRPPGGMDFIGTVLTYQCLGINSGDKEVPGGYPCVHSTKFLLWSKKLNR